MSNVSWYPEKPKETMQFFLRSFPIFVALVVFLYFGLDWLGAFEFLEFLVRDNSAWLMNIIFGIPYDDFVRGLYERVDRDILTGGIVPFGELFPGIVLDDYPKILLIIRACTGMEAGALLMALIFVTPAKWENKAVAHVVNLLMMHIGNTFRVAFHFWFTQFLYTKTSLNADDAFLYAHDWLSKVFGFIGIVIFTLVIERTGVKIVSTFSVWMDAIGLGFGKISQKIRKRSFYTTKITSQNSEESALINESSSSSQENVESRMIKTNFYPWEKIQNRDGSFFWNKFPIFFVISICFILIGLIPVISKSVGLVTDLIATNWFGAELESFTKANWFWWTSQYKRTAISFTINPFNMGLLLVGIIVGLIWVTPALRRNKIFATILTFLVGFPLTFLGIGVHKWAVWSVANNDAFRLLHPLGYINLASFVLNGIPILFWLFGFISIIIICHLFNVKIFYVLYAWLHQIINGITIALGLDEKKEKIKPSIQPLSSGNTK